MSRRRVWTERRSQGVSGPVWGSREEGRRPGGVVSEEGGRKTDGRGRRRRGTGTESQEREKELERERGERVRVRVSETLRLEG